MGRITIGTIAECIFIRSEIDGVAVSLELDLAQAVKVNEILTRAVSRFRAGETVAESLDSFLRAVSDQ